MNGARTVERLEELLASTEAQVGSLIAQRDEALAALVGHRRLIDQLNAKLDETHGEYCTKCGTTVPGGAWIVARIAELTREVERRDELLRASHECEGNECNHCFGLWREGWLPPSSVAKVREALESAAKSLRSCARMAKTNILGEVEPYANNRALVAEAALALLGAK